MEGKRSVQSGGCACGDYGVQVSCGRRAALHAYPNIRLPLMHTSVSAVMYGLEMSTEPGAIQSRITILTVLRLCADSWIQGDKMKNILCFFFLALAAGSAACGDYAASGSRKADYFSGLTLKLVPSKVVAKIGDSISLTASLCNSSKKTLRLYENTSWGVSRGILLLVKQEHAKGYKMVEIPHSMPPPDSVTRADRYQALAPGKCLTLELEGKASTFVGSQGRYLLKAVAVSYAHDYMGLPGSVWVAEEGIVESPVLHIRITN